jgi:WD40 repeat protein
VAYSISSQESHRFVGRNRRWVLLALTLTLVVSSKLSAQPSEVLRGHTAGVFDLAFAPTDDSLVSGSADHHVKFWPLRPKNLDPEIQQQHQQWLRELDDRRFEVRQKAFFNLAAAGHQVEPPLRELLGSTNSAEVRLRCRYLLGALVHPPGVGHEGDVRSVAFSSDGQFVASGGRDNTLRLWRVASGHTVAALKAHADGIWSLAFSPKGGFLASGGGDHQIRLWHHQSGTMTTILDGHQSTVQDLAFSPDGATLASAGGFDRSVRLWDVATGQLIDAIVAHQDAVLRIAFSPNGKLLATAGYDGVIQLWRVEDLQSAGEIPASTTVIRGLAFGRAGKLLVAGGDDRIVRTWETNSRRLLSSWKGHRNAIQTLTVSNDGSRLATGDRSGEIRLWDLPEVSGAR